MEIDMTFSIAELFLLAWAIIASLGFGYVTSKFNHHRYITGELLVRIAQGKMKITETDEQLTFEEI
jgi:hypothetical protein